MKALELAMDIAGGLGRLALGVGEAIKAARAGKEDEAFDILESVVDETGRSVSELQTKIQKNREEAKEALRIKFGGEDTQL